MPAIGTKQTSPSALHMSAFDPKRTLTGYFSARRPRTLGGRRLAISPK